jgi:hypothetical protein
MKDDFKTVDPLERIALAGEMKAVIFQRTDPVIEEPLAIK